MRGLVSGLFALQSNQPKGRSPQWLRLDQLLREGTWNSHQQDLKSSRRESGGLRGRLPQTRNAAIWGEDDERCGWSGTSDDTRSYKSIVKNSFHWQQETHRFEPPVQKTTYVVTYVVIVMWDVSRGCELLVRACLPHDLIKAGAYGFVAAQPWAVCMSERPVKWSKRVTSLICTVPRASWRQFSTGGGGSETKAH